MEDKFTFHDLKGDQGITCEKTRICNTSHFWDSIGRLTRISYQKHIFVRFSQCIIYGQTYISGKCVLSPTPRIVQQDPWEYATLPRPACVCSTVSGQQTCYNRCQTPHVDVG